MAGEVYRAGVGQGGILDLGRPRSQHLDVLIRHPDGADQWFAFAHAVAIRSAGHQQMEMVGQLQVMLAGCCGMFRVETLNAVQPSLDHAGDNLVRTI